MDQVRWQRLEDLLTHALDRPEAERIDFISAECGTDIALRDEVIGLLDTGPSDSLRNIVAASARSAARVEPKESSPLPAKSLLPIVIMFVALVIACSVIGRFVLVNFVAGDAAGREIHNWTLISGTSSGAPITLPGTLKAQLPHTETDYTLATDISLSQAEQGRAQSLVVDCFHSRLDLTVNGTPMIDEEGYGVGGSWRFVIPDSVTLARTLHIVLTAHHDPIGFGVAPRLVDDPRGDRRAARVGGFNHYSAIIAICLMLMLALVYAAVLSYEGARREYVSLMLVGLTATNTPLLLLGFFATVFGPFATQAWKIFAAANLLAMLTFVLATFRAGVPSRRWYIGGVVYAGLIALSATSPRFDTLTDAASVLVGLGANAYYLTVIIRAMRYPTLRSDAALMLYGFAPSVPCMLQSTWWVVTGSNPLLGLHPYSAAMMIAMASQALILGRQHAVRQRTIEHSTDELRHQVAERSRELANALGKLADHSPVSAGRVVDGRYRVVREIGAGGMGTVFEIERITDHQRFALKTLRERIEPKQMARLAREAQLAAEITHPNLVSVVDIGLADGSLYLVMELVDGGGLDRQRSQFGDVKWALPILEQVAAGLVALHAKGIVHRDLKPANILLSDGVARIADFGIALLRSDDLAETLTRTGDVFGTPAYMPPELAVGSSNATPASDVFSFGVLACEILTGSRPFSTPVVVAKAAGQPLPSPSTSAIDARLRPLVERCLDPDRTKRPTAEELAEALRALR